MLGIRQTEVEPIALKLTAAINAECSADVPAEFWLLGHVVKFPVGTAN